MLDLSQYGFTAVARAPKVEGAEAAVEDKYNKLRQMLPGLTHAGMQSSGIAYRFVYDDMDFSIYTSTHDGSIKINRVPVVERGMEVDIVVCTAKFVPRLSLSKITCDMMDDAVEKIAAYAKKAKAVKEAGIAEFNRKMREMNKRHIDFCGKRMKFYARPNMQFVLSSMPKGQNKNRERDVQVFFTIEGDTSAALSIRTIAWQGRPYNSNLFYNTRCDDIFNPQVLEAALLRLGRQCWHNGPRHLKWFYDKLAEPTASIS